MEYEDFLYTLSNPGRFLSDEQISIENTIVYSIVCKEAGKCGDFFMKN